MYKISFLKLHISAVEYLEPLTELLFLTRQNFILLEWNEIEKGCDFWSICIWQNIKEIDKFGHIRMFSKKSTLEKWQKNTYVNIWVTHLHIQGISDWK